MPEKRSQASGDRQGAKGCTHWESWSATGGAGIPGPGAPCLVCARPKMMLGCVLEAGKELFLTVHSKLRRCLALHEESGTVEIAESGPGGNQTQNPEKE